MGELAAALCAPQLGPLHVFPPWTGSALGVAARMLLGLLVIALACLFLWSRLRASRAGARPAWRPPWRPPPSVAEAEAAIERIRAGFTAEGRCREGCHALSAEMKTWFERVSAREVEEMTAEEIGRCLGPQVGGFFRRCEAVQFGQDEPRAADLDCLCRDAVRTVRGEGTVGAGRG